MAINDVRLHQTVLPRRKHNTRLKQLLIDAAAFFIMVHVILGTFFPLETYLAGGDTGEVALPLPATSITLLLSGILLVVIIFQLRLTKTKINHVYLLYLYVCIAFLSALWAEEVRIVILRGLRLAVMVGFGVVFAHYYSIKKCLRMLTVAFAVSAFLSIVVSIGFPSLGLSRLGGGYENAWRGAQGHKNYAGMIYALGIIVCYYSLRLKAVSKVAGLTGLLLCLIVILKADSATSLGAMLITIAGCSAIASLRVFPKRIRGLVAVFLVTAMIAANLLLMINLEAIFAALGRDMTFTGRSVIWEAVWQSILERPMFGYGYAFWTSGDPHATWIRMIIGDESAAHSHNTWLDIWLQLGAVALLAMTWVFIWSFLTAISQFAFHDRNICLIFLAIIAYIIARSFTEIQVTDPSIRGVFWITWCYAWLLRIKNEAPATRQPGALGRRQQQGNGQRPKTAN